MNRSLALEPTDATSAVSAGVQGYSTLSLPLAEAQALRKSIPSWAPADTPGHFFKYSDEQTIACVQVVDRLIAAEGLDVADCRDWGILVAPRFIGRLAGAGIRERFQKRGDQGVSPHTLPQHSLHSPSGALSILLGTRGPNVGMGGGPNSLTEGLLAALTMFDLNAPSSSGAGLWFVATDWSPEPLPDEQGHCTTPAVCHAIALLLRPASTAGLLGHLTLQLGNEANVAQQRSAHGTRIDQLIQALERDNPGNGPLGFEWYLPWTGRLEMHLSAANTACEAA